MALIRIIAAATSVLLACSQPLPYAFVKKYTPQAGGGETIEARFSDAFMCEDYLKSGIRNGGKGSAIGTYACERRD